MFSGHSSRTEKIKIVGKNEISEEKGSIINVSRASRKSSVQDQSDVGGGEK